MNLQQIESFLESPNPQKRIKAITELRHHEPSTVVPLLKGKMYDDQFLIRSFVAMGLGYKRNDESYEALLNIIARETDPNVIAEAAHSLAKFGPQAIPHLVTIFEKNDHWLLRQSIFPVLDDPDYSEVLLRLCCLGYDGDDVTVKLSAIANLERFKEMPQSPEAMGILLQAATDDNGLIRASAARVLIKFDNPQAQSALAELRQDSDYRVARVFLETLL